MKNLRARFKQRVSHLLKRRLQDFADYDAEHAQYFSLLQMQGKLPPIPPKALQVRVAGAYYPKFFTHGRDMFADIESILQAQGVSAYQCKNILDFGCGCGRFLIPLSYQMPPERLSGTDIDGQAIQWLKEHYPCFHDVAVNGIAPPTKYPDHTFDLVYSISIFTHLPEEMQHAWLQELARIIRPGGHGVFTVHGEKFFAALAKRTSRNELLKKGFFYNEGVVTDGLPEFYQTAFHTHEYIRREWARHFEVVAIHAEGMGKHQDAVLVRRRAA